MQADDHGGEPAGMLGWLRDLVPRLRERATWYDAPEDFLAGIEAFAASIEARLRGHPSSEIRESEDDDAATG